MLLLILSLALSQLVAAADGATCLPGQGKGPGGGCRACTSGYYQDQVNESKCKVCRRCNEESGSHVTDDCTKKSNTVCRCREGFTPIEDDYVTCQCNQGFGLRRKGVDGSKWPECLQCKPGYFSRSHDSPCVEWKKCTSGVKVTGSSTSDVTCNEESVSGLVMTPPPSPGGSASISTQLKPQSPQEGGHTLRTTTASGGSSVGKVLPTNNPSPGSHIGTAVLMCGIVGLLLLTAATCRLHITLCERKTCLPTTDSNSYRRPVEESGGSLSSSLKRNQEEV